MLAGFGLLNTVLIAFALLVGLLHSTHQLGGDALFMAQAAIVIAVGGAAFVTLLGSFWAVAWASINLLFFLVNAIAGGKFLEAGTGQSGTFWLFAGLNLVVFLVPLVAAMFDQSAVDPSWSGPASLERAPSTLHPGQLPAGQAGIRYKAVPTRVTLDDLAGMANTKQALLKAGQEAAGMRDTHGVKRRNGILLEGEPGNGKTEFAKALAGSLKLPMIYVSFGDIRSMWIGESTQNLRKIFEDTRAQAPCVLFLDEIDSFLPDRGAMVAGANSEKEDLVNEFLSASVLLREQKVVLIGATNHPDKLDAAAIRDGRFDLKIHIPCPDLAARIGLLKKFIHQYVLARSTAIRLDEQALVQVAKRWDGFSVARLEAVTRQLADDESLTVVDGPALQQALKQITRAGETRREDALSLDELVFSPNTKARVHELVATLQQAQRLVEMGQAIPRGWLLTGAPGTGKTEAAMAIAHAASWTFFSTTASELIGNPDKLATLLEKAKQSKPAILFIDEAEKVMLDRAQYHSNSTVFEALLTAMNGTKSAVSEVVFLAATNHPEMIDPAFLRGGRFGQAITFEVTDLHQVQALLQRWHAKRPQLQFAPELHLDTLYRRLAGRAHADVVSCLNQAATKAILRTPEGKVWLRNEDFA
ncbi:AAA family ATPase [Leeia oryzae]|uniref:AAA family ATPase n=1 Tax=Leeia oryzae TaxID=356662 RepID=UPI00036CCDEE|nr:ATP-binding protein [Leeia oryzae]